MRTRKYKRLEKNIVSRLVHRVSAGMHSVAGVLGGVFKFFDGKLTLMIVPHSQGKVYSFQTNVFAITLTFLIVVGVGCSFVYFNHQTMAAGAEVSRLYEENKETLASLDELRDENNNLLQAAKRFQASFSQSLSLLGLDKKSSVSQASVSNSDLTSLFSSKENVSGSIQETSDIRSLTAYLEDSVQPIEQIGKMLESQSQLFKEIPNIWPVKNPNTHISSMFGPTLHPITGQWYIHKGLDFSTYRQGDPVMATANGQVVTVGYDTSFGINVIIKHKHGMYTRYAHLSTATVTKGEYVNQGDMIGRIGNTGITTGPHLHYEVHIGSDVVDPGKYINVKLKK